MELKESDTEISGLPIADALITGASTIRTATSMPKNALAPRHINGVKTLELVRQFMDGQEAPEGRQAQTLAGQKSPHHSSTGKRGRGGVLSARS